MATFTCTKRSAPADPVTRQIDSAEPAGSPRMRPGPTVTVPPSPGQVPMNEPGFWLRKAATRSTSSVSWAIWGAVALPVTRQTVTTALGGPVPPLDWPALPPPVVAGHGPTNEPGFWPRKTVTWSTPTSTSDRIGAVALPLTWHTRTVPPSEELPPPPASGHEPTKEPGNWFRYAATWSTDTETSRNRGALALPVTWQTVTLPPGSPGRTWLLDVTGSINTTTPARASNAPRRRRCGLLADMDAPFAGSAVPSLPKPATPESDAAGRRFTPWRNPPKG